MVNGDFKMMKKEQKLRTLIRKEILKEIAKVTYKKNKYKNDLVKYLKTQDEFKDLSRKELEWAAESAEELEKIALEKLQHEDDEDYANDYNTIYF